VADFVWWSGLTAAMARRGIDIVGNQLKSEDVNGKTYWITPSSQDNARPKGRMTHLLPTYDEYLIAYKDRSAAMPDGLDQKQIEAKVVFEAPVVVDGQVVGSWKRVIGKTSVTTRVTPFVRLTKADQTRVVRECEAYANFLQLESKSEWLSS
jgi:hypothetical protein